MKHCEVIRDLIPLYVDGCCSENTRTLVEEHLAVCPACKEEYALMKGAFAELSPVVPTKRFTRVQEWKASLLQSVLLFASFLAITFGVAMEAASPSGLLNGFWAFALVIPTTGFMLSLANWYFVRLYKSRKKFVLCSCLVTAGLIVAAYLWGLWHYEAFDAALYFLKPQLGFL
ncbi:MAG: zf-HC2 domain-containing protein, partial [Clostridia bacterium]|nr:zf-HC2 domain-containing protein [Clostridia bacterium]